MSDAAGSTGGGAAPSAPTTSAAPVAVKATGGPAPANTNGSAREPAANDQSGAPPEARHKLKIGGEERELPLSEILKLASKGEGAEQRFRQAAEKEREIENLLRKLPEDTIGALEHLVGDRSRAAKSVMAQLMKDPRTRAEVESFLVETYEYESKPEPERRKVDEHRDLQAKAKRLEEIEKRDQEQRYTQEVQQHQQRFAQGFTQALGASGIPVTQHTMARMALHTEHALERHERVTLAEIAGRVRDELRADVSAHVGSLDADALAELLGEEKLGALRKRDVEKLRPRAPMPERMPGAGKGRAEKPAGEPKRVGTSAFFRKLRGEG
jgi:hypothetical protein